jgi:hypothetical protein
LCHKKVRREDFGDHRDPRQNSSPFDFRAEAGHDRRMVDVLIVIGRALALALRGHWELVLD